jgi:hypothetical protein
MVKDEMEELLVVDGVVQTVSSLGDCNTSAGLKPCYK